MGEGEGIREGETRGAVERRGFQPEPLSLRCSVLCFLYTREWALGGFSGPRVDFSWASFGLSVGRRRISPASLIGRQAPLLLLAENPDAARAGPPSAASPPPCPSSSTPSPSSRGSSGKALVAGSTSPCSAAARWPGRAGHHRRQALLPRAGAKVQSFRADQPRPQPQHCHLTHRKRKPFNSSRFPFLFGIHALP